MVADPAFPQISLSRLASYRGVTRARAQELAEEARSPELPLKARLRLQREDGAKPRTLGRASCSSPI